MTVQKDYVNFLLMELEATHKSLFHCMALALLYLPFFGFDVKVPSTRYLLFLVHSPSKVKQVMLYWLETCLRRILSIWWRDKVRNVDLWKRTGQEPIGLQILRTSGAGQDIPSGNQPPTSPNKPYSGIHRGREEVTTGAIGWEMCG